MVKAVRLFGSGFPFCFIPRFRAGRGRKGLAARLLVFPAKNYKNLCAPLQAIMLMITFGIPDVFLSILPTAVLAEIAVADTKATGQNKEGMYFGLRALTQKFGPTLGIMLFAMLTLYGKDPGNDLGLRLSGVVGAVLCLFAGIVYTRYKE